MPGYPDMTSATSVATRALSRQRRDREKYLVVVTRGLRNRDVEALNKVKTTGIKIIGVGKLTGVTKICSMLFSFFFLGMLM